METPISPKVTVAVLAAAVVTIVVFGADALWSVDVPVLVQGAITTAIVAFVGWFKKDKLRVAGQAAISAQPTTPVGTIPAVAEISAQS